MPAHCHQHHSAPLGFRISAHYCQNARSLSSLSFSSPSLPSSAHHFICPLLVLVVVFSFSAPFRFPSAPVTHPLGSPSYHRLPCECVCSSLLASFSHLLFRMRHMPATAPKGLLTVIPIVLRFNNYFFRCARLTHFLLYSCTAFLVNITTSSASAGTVFKLPLINNYCQRYCFFCSHAIKWSIEWR